MKRLVQKRDVLSKFNASKYKRVSSMGWFRQGVNWKKKIEVIQYYIMKFNLLYYEVIRSYLILYYQVTLYVCFILFSNL